MGLFDFIKKQTPASGIDYYELVARGLIDGAQQLSAYGKATVGAATATKLLWANGTWVVPPKAGANVSIVSSSVEDGQDGTGIRSVHIHYLDENLEPQSITAVLNGTTPVKLSGIKVRFIQCGHMQTYGSTKKAVGTIQFKDTDTGAIYNEIDPLETRCSSSARMCPKGKRLIVTGGVASSVSGTAASGCLVSISTSHFEGHDYTQDAVLIPHATMGLQDSTQTVNLKAPLIVTEGHIVGVLFSTDKGATVSASWFGIVEPAQP